MLIIDREAREIIRLVTSVRPSVRLSVRLFVCLSDTLTGGHLKERSSWLRFQNVCVFKMVAR